jgi:hypothetical protein
MTRDDPLRVLLSDSKFTRYDGFHITGVYAGKRILTVYVEKPIRKV